MVDANGYLSLEGEAVSSGRLTLVPVGEGKRAQSLVAEDGEFAFRTDGVPGAVPGSYSVMFSRELAAEQANRNVGAGQEATEELSVIYQSSKKKPLVIPEDGTLDLRIDIRREDGWKRSVAG